MTAILSFVLNVDYCRKRTLYLISKSKQCERDYELSRRFDFLEIIYVYKGFYRKIDLICTLANESCATLDNASF